MWGYWCHADGHHIKKKLNFGPVTTERKKDVLAKITTPFDNIYRNPDWLLVAKCITFLRPGNSPLPRATSIFAESSRFSGCQ